MLTKATACADYFVLALLLMFSTGALGQKNGKHSLKQTGAEITVLSLSFKEEKAFPIAAPPVMSYPIRCGADGTVYVEMLQAPEYLKRRLISVSANEVHAFDLQTITELAHIEAIDYFPSESELAFLITAAKGSEETTRTFTLPNGEKQEEKWPKSELHAYVARFDLTGKYLGATQIDDNIAPEKIAVFTSGNLLIWGADRVTKSPHLVLAKSSGEILRYLDVPEKITHHMAWQGNAPRRIGRASMVQFRGGLLLVKPLSTAPLLWIRESGAVETISLKLPDGLVIDSALPSDSNLYLRLRQATERQSSDTSRKGEPLLYQFNIENGLPVAQFTAADHSIPEIACVVENEFVSLHRNEDGNLVRMVGR